MGAYLTELTIGGFNPKAAAVALLWLIVRRHFGVTAATVAALVLSLTPIAVAVNRLNLPEPFYILALIGAGGCVLRSIEGGSRWWAWTASTTPPKCSCRARTRPWCASKPRRVTATR